MFVNVLVAMSIEVVGCCLLHLGSLARSKNSRVYILVDMNVRNASKWTLFRVRPWSSVSSARVHRQDRHKAAGGLAELSFWRYLAKMLSRSLKVAVRGSGVCAGWKNDARGRPLRSGSGCELVVAAD